MPPLAWQLSPAAERIFWTTSLFPRPFLLLISQGHREETGREREQRFCYSSVGQILMGQFCATHLIKVDSACPRIREGQLERNPRSNAKLDHVEEQGIWSATEEESWTVFLFCCACSSRLLKKTWNLHMVSFFFGNLHFYLGLLTLCLASRSSSWVEWISTSLEDSYIVCTTVKS